jgi:hypothetical protein
MRVFIFTFVISLAFAAAPLFAQAQTAPTASIQASGCEIPAGASTCNAITSWSSYNTGAAPGRVWIAIVTPNWTNNFDNPAFISNNPVPFDAPGVYTLEVLANASAQAGSGTVIAQTSVTVTCASGSTWSTAQRLCVPINTVKGSFDYSTIKSVTYTIGVCDTYCRTLVGTDPVGDVVLFQQQLPAIKDAGFNAVYIPSAWYQFEPTALPSPQYNDVFFNHLRQKLALLRANHMQAIIPLNYYGAGWTPGGIAPGFDMLQDPQQYAAFENYVHEFLSRISDYSDVAMVMVFTEGTELSDDDVINGASFKNGVYCGGQRYTSGYAYTYSDCFRPTYAQTLRNTLGSIPTRLPADLKKFRFGYHDYSLINIAYGKGSYPIASPNPFDFFSATLYPEYWDANILAEAQTSPSTFTAAIANEIATRLGRFKQLYPGTPVILGESGRSTCYADAAPGGDVEQGVVDGAIIKAALSQGFGFNIWDWNFARGYENGVPWSCKAGLGYDLLKADGTPRATLSTIKQLLGSYDTAYAPSPAPVTTPVQAPATVTGSLTVAANCPTTSGASCAVTESWTSSGTTAVAVYVTNPVVTTTFWDGAAVASTNSTLGQSNSGGHTFNLPVGTYVFKLWGYNGSAWILLDQKQSVVSNFTIQSALDSLSTLQQAYTPTSTVVPTPSTDASLIIPGGFINKLTTIDGTWSFSTQTAGGGYIILLNGQQAGNGSGVELLVANKGKIYTLNTINAWYTYSTGTWQSTVSPVGGNFDGLKKNTDGTYTAYGWTCVKGATTPINVEMDFLTPTGQKAVYTSAANQTSELAVQQACGVTSGAYRFSIPLTYVQNLSTYAGNKIYVYPVIAGKKQPALPNSGTVVVPTLVTPSVNRTPIGVLGIATSTYLQGWVYDPDSTSTPVDITIYVDGAQGSGSTVFALLANVPRSDVAAGVHGYHWLIPAAYQTRSHTWYVYGHDVQTSTWTLLSGSPKTTKPVTTATVMPTPVANISVTDLLASAIAAPLQMVTDALSNLFFQLGVY